MLVSAYLQNLNFLFCLSSLFLKNVISLVNVTLLPSVNSYIMYKCVGKC